MFRENKDNQYFTLLIFWFRGKIALMNEGPNPSEGISHFMIGQQCLT
jgi:hypothetical protein